METKSVIFWGAGATKQLGMRLTVDQAKFIQILAGVKAPLDKQPDVQERVTAALNRHSKGRDALNLALVDLLTILGDGNENHKSITKISADERDAMGRNMPPGTRQEAIDGNIVNLRLTYDWPALKSIVRVCPGSTSEAFQLNDLFNVLDMHGPAGFGFRAPSPVTDDGAQFLAARRLMGAKDALRMLLGVAFYIDHQDCIRDKTATLKLYQDFATLLGRRMQELGVALAHQGKPPDQPEFYQGDVSFVSLNYDPLALWVQYISNRELNLSPDVPHVGNPAQRLQLFSDGGHLVPSRRIGEPFNGPWYPMNEAVAQRLNEAVSEKGIVRLTKFLFPHGCLCWRECPDCGKLSSYMGDEWKLDSPSLIPPPPLWGFDKTSCPDTVKGDERKKRQSEWRVDTRACVHCGTLTYAHHTQTVMQSSLKAQPPSFIEEIQRDLRAVAMKADHFIFMGYSLPKDDVIYRAFFSARKQVNEKPKTNGTAVRCTVVGRDYENAGWYSPAELDSEKFRKYDAITSARDIFGSANVRFFGGGVPDVFLENGVATEQALNRLLKWS